jgi:glycosyltransferase involved in cell wall biosynthesis
MINVIMSVYNGEKWLTESIVSILNQTYKDFEFLIYDDGSTDDTRKILFNISEHDNRIRIGFLNENIGLTKALNKCLGQCQYDYIARIDADDVAYPQLLEKQVSFLDKNQDIVAVGCRLEVCDESLNPLTTWCELSNPLKIEESLLNPNHVGNFILPHSGIMYKRDAVFTIGGYDENYQYSEDVDLYLRLIENGGKLTNLPDTLMKYRLHNDSLCHIGEFETMNWHEEIANKLTKITEDIDKYLANVITDAQNKDPRSLIQHAIERLNERNERIKKIKDSA